MFKGTPSVYLAPVVCMSPFIVNFLPKQDQRSQKLTPQRNKNKPNKLQKSA